MCAEISCGSEQTVVAQLQEQLSQCRADLAKFRKDSAISRIDTWAGCPPEAVDSIPYEIDGLQQYVIKCSKPDMMKVSQDGRPWKTWFTTTRKGFHGTRRRANCKGSSICKCEMCPFYKEHGKSNRVQFRKDGGQYVCFSCESVTEQIPCPAVKAWEYHESLESVIVYHVGKHTCVCKPKMPRLHEVDAAVRKHPTLTPVQVANHELVDYLARDDSDFSWEELDGILDNLIDTPRLQYARQKQRQQDEPCGVNFDALSLLKARCDKQDRFLMYKVNSRAMSNTASYVFKSSKNMAELALSMDRDHRKFLSEEYAFIDVKHNRCRGFKAITLWTYHPVMRKLIRLAIMDVEEENTDNLTNFWLIFNDMLREVSGDDAYLFNPTGFISDEHHANFHAIYRVFGNGGKDRIRTCEFHYVQSVQRHARYLDVVAGEEFKQLADEMLKAPSRTDLETVCARMCAFCNDHAEVKPWFQWWYKRKDHVCRAYKQTETPHSNLAEVGHSKMASVGRSHMSLLDAAKDDVVFALRQHKELAKFVQGGRTGGTGDSIKSRRARRYRADLKRAAAYAQELDLEAAAASDKEESYMPPSGTHRPPRRRKVTKKFGAQPKKAQTAVATTCMAMATARACSRGIRLKRHLRTIRKRNVRLRSLDGSREEVSKHATQPSTLQAVVTDIRTEQGKQKFEQHEGK